MLDIKPFVKLLKQKDAKRAREWLETNKGSLNMGNEFENGYLLALQGMISALESSSELSTINKVLDKNYKSEQVSQIVKETKGRLSQKFRQNDEKGFDTAWIDVLGELSGENA